MWKHHWFPLYQLKQLWKPKLCWPEWCDEDPLCLVCNIFSGDEAERWKNIKLYIMPIKIKCIYGCCTRIMMPRNILVELIVQSGSE